jgi:outer membrane protein TolC
VNPFRTVSVVALAALLSTPSVAAEPPAPYVTPEYIRRPPSLPPRVDAARVWRLKLSEALETSMRRNLQLNLQRERTREAAEGRSLARGAFEPVVSARVGRSQSESPPRTAQEGRAGEVLKFTNDAWSVGIAEHLPTGTDLRLEFASSRSESALGTAVAPRLFRSEVGFSVNQPLLRDFSFDLRVPRAGVLRAEFASARALEEARLRALLTVKATEDAYWNLVEIYKAYEVNVGALDLAQKQLELTRRQISVGVLPESDVISAEGSLAQRQLALVRAEAQIERASDLLRALMNLPPADWERPLLPVDTPEFLPVRLDVAAAVDRAAVARPELKQAGIELRRVALDLEVGRNARLPRLDLQFGIGSVGQDQSYRETLDQVTRFSGRQWNLGLALTWAPLGAAARAEVRRLQSALRQTEMGREQFLVDIRSQIREAVRAIDTADREIRAAAHARELAERSLDVEQRRFLNNLSSNFLVAQRQAEVAQARLSELAAIIQHEKATLDLQLSTGDLLEARKVQFVVSGGG